MKTESALKLVQNAYLNYGQYVNSVRSLPHINDGLKIVQRRILLAAKDSGAASDMVKTASVSGNTLAKYHPHGDASTNAAIETLVNKHHSLLLGKGNWGYHKGFTSVGAAAARYTSLKLSELGNEYLKYKDYAPKFENDLSYQEPEYLPYCIPYALLSGTSGIGIGITCNIPAITTKSLVQYIEWYLTGKGSRPLLYPSATGGGWITYTEEDIINLNDKGHCNVTVGANVNNEWDPVEGKYGIVITGNPDRINYNRIKRALARELEEKLVFIRDESKTNTRIIIHRYERIRKISDEELLSIIKSSVTRNIHHLCVVSDGKIARTIGVREWLETSISAGMAGYSGSIESQFKKLKLELKFHEIRPQLAKLLISDTELSIIKDKLLLSQDEFDYCINKSIKSLSSKEFPIKLISDKIDIVKDKLSKTEYYYFKELNVGAIK